MNAVERGKILFGQMARDRFVGGDHEFFDDPVRYVALGAHDVFRQALQIENDFGFW